MAEVGEVASVEVPGCVRIRQAYSPNRSARSVLSTRHARVKACPGLAKLEVIGDLERQRIAGIRTAARPTPPRNHTIDRLQVLLLVRHRPQPIHRQSLGL
jgi:hypothetical protein